ncbi:MAG: hypothetical protein GY861_04490, partial [bacterium]|nr:hypothetical protein [bacterium]
FFKNTSYEGDSILVKETNITNLISIGWHDHIRSIKVAPRMELILYQFTSFKGKKVIIKKNVKDTKKTFMKILPLPPKSSKILQSRIPVASGGCIIIFDEKNYEGNSKVICNATIFDLHAKGWSMPVKSIKVGPKTIATVYPKSRNQGKKFQLIGEVSDLKKKHKIEHLGSVKVVKITHSLKKGPVATWRGHLIDSATGVVKNAPITEPHVGCVLIYKDEKFKGIGKHICNDIGMLPSHWNNKVSSLKVGPHTKVTIYPNKNFTGKSVTVTKNVINLSGKGMNDKVTSLKVQKIVPGTHGAGGPVSDWRGQHINSKTGKVTGKSIIRPPPFNVKPGCVVLFDHVRYGGKKVQFCRTKSNLGRFNNLASSFKLGKATKVQFF